MCESCNVKKNTRSLSCVWLNHFVIGARIGLGGQAMARPLLCLLAVWLYKIIESVCLSLLCHATDCIANWSIYCLRLSEHVYNTLRIHYTYTCASWCMAKLWMSLPDKFYLNMNTALINLLLETIRARNTLCIHYTHTCGKAIWMSLLDKFSPNMNTAFHASK